MTVNIVVVLSVPIFYICTVLLTLLMMTAESMLSKRPVLKIMVTLFFLHRLFLSHICCIPLLYLLLSTLKGVLLNIAKD